MKMKAQWKHLRMKIAHYRLFLVVTSLKTRKKIILAKTKKTSAEELVVVLRYVCCDYTHKHVAYSSTG